MFFDPWVSGALVDADVVSSLLWLFTSLAVLCVLAQGRGCKG